MACREIRKFGVLEIAPDDPLDCKVPVVESERGLERLFTILETSLRVAGELWAIVPNSRIHASEWSQTDQNETHMTSIREREHVVSPSRGLADPQRGINDGNRDSATSGVDSEINGENKFSSLRRQKPRVV